MHPAEMQVPATTAIHARENDLETVCSLPVAAFCGALRRNGDRLRNYLPPPI